MHTWIGLGSNIGDGPEALREALQRIDAAQGVCLIRCSGFYRTEPWGFAGQGIFTNAVAEVENNLEPLALLQALQHIEIEMGRRRGGRRWGPRRIDLDILLVSDRLLFLEGLTVPHPRMHRRSFVLRPLAELEPGLVIPARGKVSAFLARVPDGSVEKLPGDGLPGEGALQHAS